MAEFKDLIKDIHAYLAGDHGREDFSIESTTAKNIIDMSKRLATHTLEIVDHRAREPRSFADHTIRFSELGEPCPRKLYYKWYEPQLGQPPHAENGHPTLPVKFLFGDYMEELVLFLAKEAGHEVSHRQHEVKIEAENGWVGTGHLDAMIDGWVVDVKSAADASFQKYKREGLTKDTDSFGYISQLDSYAEAMGTLNRAFIFINKHDGELMVIDRSSEPLHSTAKLIEHWGEAMESFVKPDRRDVKDDSTGYGKKLDVVCSYCAFKWACRSPMKAYVVSGRPVYYTELTSKGEKYFEGKTKIPPPSLYK